MSEQITSVWHAGMRSKTEGDGNLSAGISGERGRGTRLNAIDTAVQRRHGSAGVPAGTVTLGTKVTALSYLERLYDPLCAESRDSQST